MCKILWICEEVKKQGKIQNTCNCCWYDTRQLCSVYVDGPALTTEHLQRCSSVVDGPAQAAEHLQRRSSVVDGPALAAKHLQRQLLCRHR